MKRRHLGTALLALILVGPIAWSSFGEVARAGMLGFAGELLLNSRPDNNGRSGITSLPPSFSSTLNNVDYSFDLKMLTTPLALDWYPFFNSFHLSGGILVSRAWLGLDTRTSATFDMGGSPYSAQLRGGATYHPIAPYVGLGWSNAFGKEKRWSVVSNIGLAFLGRPHVSVTATGPSNGDPTSQSTLDREEDSLHQELDHIRFYPVVSVSLFFRF
jgi:hypothetical protein